jgi:Leucine-rich repeat (LRR) protein
VLCYDTPNANGYLHVEKLELLNMNLTGNLAPEIGILQNLTILDFMWNDISGSIPKEIGNMTSLQLLLLNGNQLSGPLPEELGNLSHLIRLQIDQNKISGSIPKSFANLTMALHIHMNNNSLSGQIPEELYKLPKLIHLLVDNNNLTGELPPELANIPKLEVLQLDNNPFINSVIPVPYANMKHLVKLSLRNCSLHGSVPDFSTIPALSYLDLSYNGLTGNISAHKLSSNITTIDLSHNKLKGPIPSSFAGLPLLQKLLLNNNNLTGFAPSDNGSSISFNSTRKLLLDFRNNNVTDITRLEEKSPNIILWLDGNPVCSQVRIYDISKLCSTENGSEDACGSSNNNNTTCSLHSCSSRYYGPNSNSHCFSAPVEVGYRLKSPSFSFFSPYIKMFGEYLTSELNLDLHQLSIVSYSWSPGPRLDMNLKIFPPKDSSGRELNESTILQIQNKFTAWQFTKNDILGPYEYLSLTTYNDHESGLSKGALAGILIGTIFGTAVVTSIIVMMILKRQAKYSEVAARKKFLAKKPVKVAGVKDFDFEEMTLATNNFSDSMQIGQGGYGRVYKGLLNDGTVVAIKRAREGSLQGEKEFSTEIELLSRLHHRNLVSLLGYCDDQEEQMLVYEYMGNGTLRDHLAGNFQLKPLDFALRLRIALGSAKGILYLHNEANPPIFHRDIKASNILLDNKFNARVADFGLSKLASLPDMEGSALDHVSTVVKGTPGYLDPEYFLTHQLTDKSDVYSFGVVLLELLTGMEPISHGKNIVREVNMAYQCGNMLSMIDKRMGSYPSECLEPFASLALRCCKDETDARPAIAEVVQVLQKIVQLMPPGADLSSTPSLQSHIYPMGIEKSSIDISTENPYISSDITGSDLLSGNIPGVAPR